MRALQHRGDALEPHAGVDGGLGQRPALVRRHLLVLHEDEVPDFDHPVPVSIGHGIARHRRPLVEMDFRAGPAGTRIGHLPEIIRFVAAHDTGRRHADLLPELERLVVFAKHRDPEPVLGQTDRPGQVIPSVEDRIGLEVVAEGKIAEHFKEGMVPSRVADVFQIVMLAAGPHALLHRDGPLVWTLLFTQKHPLELVHAGVGEENGRVRLGDQRRTGDGLVPVPLEILDEALPKRFRRLAHDDSLTPHTSAMMSSSKPYRRSKPALRRRSPVAVRPSRSARSVRASVRWVMPP